MAIRSVGFLDIPDGKKNFIKYIIDTSNEFSDVSKAYVFLDKVLKYIN